MLRPSGGEKCGLFPDETADRCTASRTHLALISFQDEHRGLADLQQYAKLAATVSIPIVRGPAASANVLAALDILSGGRLIVGVGPGSSAKDYAAAGVHLPSEASDSIEVAFV